MIGSRPVTWPSAARTAAWPEASETPSRSWTMCVDAVEAARAGPANAASMATTSAAMISVARSRRIALMFPVMLRP